MDERAEEIISHYEKQKSEDILQRFNSLKPKPFSGLISLAVIFVGMWMLSNFTDMVNFDGEDLWFFMPFIVVSVAIERESRKINQRIDLLAKLVNLNQTNCENT